MNEIFGEENFVGELIWKSRQNKDNRNVTGLSIDHEYVLCYSKYNEHRVLKGADRKTGQYANPDNDPRGSWVSGNMVGLLGEDMRPNCHYDLINPRTGINYGKPRMGWRYDSNTMQRLIEEDRIIWPKTADGRPRRKVFLTELNNLLPNYTSVIGNGIYTRTGTKEINDLFEGKYFDFPKPSSLIMELIKQVVTSGERSIVLDFFAGSCSTAHAVMRLKKDGLFDIQFICVQLPELCDEKSEAYKAGYKTIAEIAKERIRRAGVKIREEVEKEQAAMNEKLQFEGDQDSCQMPDLGFKVFKLTESNFKQWREIKGSDKDAWEQQLFDFIDPVADNAVIDNMVYELLLKNGKDLNSAVVLKNRYYTVNGKELIFLLDSASQEIINDVLNEKPNKVIALDRLFEGDDQLKTNTALQMRDAGIEFKTI